MPDATATLAVYLRAAGHTSLDQLVSDYAFVRAGDLASLAFCSNWTDVDPDGCGHAIRLQGTTLFFSRDPCGGRTIEIEVDAREIVNQSFSFEADARKAVAAASMVTLRGLVTGDATPPVA